MLTEAGYKLEVQSYNLEELVEESPAWKFTEKLQEAKRGQFWYSHQTDLLRYLILFKWGGVYMDTDVIIVCPVDSLRTNVIAYEDPYHKSANGAFMKFEKGNLFIKECLEDFPESYSSRLWAGSGPKLLARIWKHWNGSSDEVHVLDNLSFYMFYYNDVKKQCFSETAGDRFDFNMKILKEKAYVVHLNSMITGNEGMSTRKLQEGTICSHLLNSYCVLCNKQY